MSMTPPSKHMASYLVLKIWTEMPEFLQEGVLTGNGPGQDGFRNVRLYSHFSLDKSFIALEHHEEKAHPWVLSVGLKDQFHFTAEFEKLTEVFAGLRHANTAWEEA